MKRCNLCRQPLSVNCAPSTVRCLRCRHRERMRVAGALKRAAREIRT
jgi:hypothetical protein